MPTGDTKKRVAVIGDGGWGTALAIVLHDNGHEVTIWGPHRDYIDEIRTSSENSRFLPGVRLPGGLAWTADRKVAAEGARIAVLAVPTRYFRPVAESFAGLLPASCIAMSVAKGLDQTTGKRMTEVAEEVLGLCPVAALSGPSHAEEVARHIPTAVVIACSDIEVAGQLAGAFMNSRFRVYTLPDVLGVELGGALKNVIAIAAGVSDGIGFGDNTKAALITRGVAEMARLGCALGAERSTFAGLSGIGDLVVTCGSRHSRNRAVGERLGRGETISSILDSTTQAVEGVWCCAIAKELAKKAGIEVPITEEVYAIVHENKDPHEALESLMSREAKSETE